MLGVTPLTLRNWDKKGKLIAYRHPINNYRVYRLDQVELFLRAMESGTGNIVLQSKKLKIDFLED